MQPETKLDIEQIVRAMLIQQRNELADFINEWAAARSEGVTWVSTLDASVQLVAEAYREELERLLRGETASREWMDMIEAAQLLRLAALDCFLGLKTGRTDLSLSDPQNLADRAYGFLVDVAYLFSSSLGELRKTYPSKKTVSSCRAF